MRRMDRLHRSRAAARRGRAIRVPRRDVLREDRVAGWA